MYVQVQDYCQQTAANTQPALKSGLARPSSLARKPVFAYRPIYSATMPDALHSTLLSSVIQAHAHAHTHCICNGCWFVTALPCSSIKASLVFISRTRSRLLTYAVFSWKPSSLAFLFAVNVVVVVVVATIAADVCCCYLCVFCFGFELISFLGPKSTFKVKL